MSSAPAEPLGDVLARKYRERPWLYGSLTALIAIALLWWTCAPNSGSRTGTGGMTGGIQDDAEEVALTAARENMDRLSSSTSSRCRRN